MRARAIENRIPVRAIHRPNELMLRVPAGFGSRAGFFGSRAHLAFPSAAGSNPRTRFFVTAMAASYKYVVAGGGQSAGYAAAEFVKRGAKKGEVAIISDEPVRPGPPPRMQCGRVIAFVIESQSGCWPFRGSAMPCQAAVGCLAVSAQAPSAVAWGGSTRSQTRPHNTRISASRNRRAHEQRHAHATERPCVLTEAAFNPSEQLTGMLTAALRFALCQFATVSQAAHCLTSHCIRRSSPTSAPR